MTSPALDLHSVRCPVSGEDWSFFGLPEIELGLTVEACRWEAERFLELSHAYGFSFQDIHTMLRTAVLGPSGADPDFNPATELAALRNHARTDAELLRRGCTLTQAVAIWKRGERYFQLLAQLDPSPAVRAKAAAELQRGEDAMAEIECRFQREVPGL
jgi:hypothetical protein